jgi:serine/threonine-protein kinase
VSQQSNFSSAIHNRRQDFDLDLNRLLSKSLGWVKLSMVGRVFLGRYEALELLGEGGMGRVYLARQLDLGRQVVVKVMHDHLAADPKFSERFQRETLLMARFQHPYAVTLYDASLNDPQGPCIVMEYIRGVTLDTLLLRNGRLTPKRAGRLLGQLCEVLQAAHSEKIIHRDLKPANLMVVDPDTPYEKIKVMDFGLAKLVDPKSFRKATGSGPEFAIGTPGYMCPEQARGADMDHRGDLYSVGAILYELLSGRLPFAGRSTMDTLLAHVTEQPPMFSEIGCADWVPKAVEQVIRACLSKEPNHRPAHARELAERYDAALNYAQETQARAVPAPSPPEQRAASRPSFQKAPLATKGQDDDTIVHHLDAWMPEAIASYKLKGFVHDAGGEILESVPGRIKVRLGGQGSIYASRGSALSWLGLGRRTGLVDMELLLQRPEAKRENQLHIVVVMKAHNGDHVNDAWRERCSQIYCDLRGYLMGQS